MAMPAVKLFSIGGLVYLTPKTLGSRLIIDIRQFKTYESEGKEYPTKEGIFLYLGQYAKVISLCQSNRKEFFEIPDTQPTEIKDKERHDIGYGAYLAQGSIGTVSITVPSRQGSRTISLCEDQIDSIIAQESKIEENIKAFKAYLAEKEKAEEEADREEEEADAEDEKKPKKKRTVPNL